MWIRTADIVLCGEESIEVNLRNELIATFSFMKTVIEELAKSLPSHGLPPPLTSHRLGACRCASPNRSGCRSMSRCAVRPLLHLLHLRLLLHRRYSRAGGALRRPKRVPPRSAATCRPRTPRPPTTTTALRPSRSRRSRRAASGVRGPGERRERGRVRGERVAESERESERPCMGTAEPCESLWQPSLLTCGVPFFPCLLRTYDRSAASV